MNRQDCKSITVEEEKCETCYNDKMSHLDRIFAKCQNCGYLFCIKCISKIQCVRETCEIYDLPEQVTSYLQISLFHFRPIFFPLEQGINNPVCDAANNRCAPVILRNIAEEFILMAYDQDFPTQGQKPKDEDFIEKEMTLMIDCTNQVTVTTSKNAVKFHSGNAVSI